MLNDGKQGSFFKGAQSRKGLTEDLTALKFPFYQRFLMIYYVI